MKDATRIKLHPSETAVLHAASRIYAARLTLQPGGDKTTLMEEAIQEAVDMARRIDVLVKSDEEMS